MSLAESKQEFRRRVSPAREFRRQLRIRRNLERIIYRELVKVFRDWLGSTLYLYTEFGTYQSGVAAGRLQAEIQPTLTNFYKRIFQTVIESNVSINEKKNEQKQEEVMVFGRSINFEELVDEYFINRELVLANISRTLAIRIDRIIQEGRARDLSVAQIARDVQSVLGPAIRSRANLIARTETHNAASFANHRYYQTVSDELEITMKKQWVASGDLRTSDFHQEASGTIKDMDEPFEIDGELLNHPGDSSLGASAKNVVNCRCVLVYADERDLD